MPHWKSPLVDSLPEIFQEIRAKETEDNWEHKEQAFLKLQQLSQENPSSIVTCLKNLGNLDAFLRTINSLRSQLAITACQTLCSVVKSLKGEFEPFSELSLAALLKACAQTKKIVANCAAQSVKVLIFELPSCKYLGQIHSALQDKNPSLKAKAAEFLRDLVPKVDFRPSSSKSTAALELVECCLRCALGDANCEVRQCAREVMDMYQLIWPEKVMSFLESLDYSTRKQLSRRDESHLRPNSALEKEEFLLEQVQSIGLSCPAGSSKANSALQSPRKSLYEEYILNESKRVSSRTKMEKSIEFLQSNAVEMRIFRALDLIDLEELALQHASSKFHPIALFDEGKPEPEGSLNCLKNIIIKSKDDTLWNASDFESAIQACTCKFNGENKQNALYALFVLLSNRGDQYAESVEFYTWKSILKILADPQTPQISSFSGSLVVNIEDDIIQLLGNKLSFYTVISLFCHCCDSHVFADWQSPKEEDYAASCVEFSNSKYVEIHFDLLHQALSNAKCEGQVEEIAQNLSTLKESLYQSLLCSKTKFLANKIFIELYGIVGGARLFDVFCSFDRPKQEFLRISCSSSQNSIAG